LSILVWILVNTWPICRLRDSNTNNTISIHNNVVTVLHANKEMIKRLPVFFCNSNKTLKLREHPKLSFAFKRSVKPL
jgi:hypothetical protein